MSRCPRLLNLPHVHMSTKSTVINTVVTFSCDPGYILVGNRHIICTTKGEWNGIQPMCMRELKCIEVYRLQTNHHIYIELASVYRHINRYAWGCYIDSLCAVAQLQFRTLQLRNKNCSHTSIHDTLIVHFYLIFPTSLLLDCDCKAILVFTEIIPTSPLSIGEYQDTCPPLPTVAHGRPSTYNTEIGTQVTYSCDRGYVLIGYKTISCYRRGRWGMWNGPPPFCMRKQPCKHTNNMAYLVKKCHLQSLKSGQRI